MPAAISLAAGTSLPYIFVDRSLALHLRLALLTFPGLPKRIAILGSTGSIGVSTLDVIRHLGSPFQATVLTAHRNLELLAKQVAEFKPKVVVVTDESADAGAVRRAIGPGPDILHGKSGLISAVQRDDVDLVVGAIVGAAGLPAVLAAVEAKKTSALAN